MDVDVDDRLFSACANGKVSDLTNLMSYAKSTVDVNRSSSRGWTGLMYAARNGHGEITELLLEHGADRDVQNNLGQTAYDIASFWSHPQVMKLLANEDDNKPQEPVHFFTVKDLDRASEKRKDLEWLRQTLTSSPDTRIIAFVNTMPILEFRKNECNLKQFSYTDLAAYIDETDLDSSGVVLLGLSHTQQRTYFAVDLSKDEGTEVIEAARRQSDADLHILERIRNAFILPSDEAAMAGLAHSIIEWHSRCQYCQSCGSQTKFSEAGYKRTCTNSSCLTVREVKNSSYPRLDPTIIASVISPDKTQILLARGLKFVPNMWSCLAGFMEPGESIEDACRREVYEEVGVKLGRVTYHSSQPWPFPTQLMVGLIGHASSQSITVDRSELADARWFSRNEVVKMMNRRHPGGLFIPPHQAIAHHLIKSFLHLSVAQPKL